MCENKNEILRESPTDDLRFKVKHIIFGVYTPLY